MKEKFEDWMKNFNGFIKTEYNNRKWWIDKKVYDKSLKVKYQKHQK